MPESVAPWSIGVRDARHRFFELIDRAEKGETVIITRHGREVARPDPPASRGTREGGWMDGELRMAPDFDDTSRELIDLFEGSARNT